MLHKTKRVLSRRPKTIRAVVLLFSITLAAMALHGWPEARAEVEKLNPPAHFLSGDERSEVLLREMLTVLKRIDLRLERLERSVGIKDEAPAETSNHRKGGRR